MAALVPGSWGALNRPSRLREYNPCHEPGGSPRGGQFGKKGTSGCSGGSAKGSTDKTSDGSGRPKAIRVSSVEEAVTRILKGEIVELPDVRKVNTVITKLAGIARDAKARGENAPNYDLCQVSVPGTNLFCAGKLRTKAYPDGVPRIAMPQLGGKPVQGSEADKLPRNPWDQSEVDGAPAFIEFLTSKGIRASIGTARASKLKASQSELVGSKVAAMMVDQSFDPAANPIFISRDGYVVDGHHRWAAVVGRDAEDGVLGNHSRMNVVRVNAPIAELLQIANKWSRQFGIHANAGPSKKRKVA